MASIGRMFLVYRLHALSRSWVPTLPAIVVSSFYLTLWLFSLKTIVGDIGGSGSSSDGRKSFYRNVFFSFIRRWSELYHKRGQSMPFISLPYRSHTCITTGLEWEQCGLRYSYCSIHGLLRMTVISRSIRPNLLIFPQLLRQKAKFNRTHARITRLIRLAVETGALKG